jgi:hypothetical protein
MAERLSLKKKWTPLANLQRFIHANESHVTPPKLRPTETLPQSSLAIASGGHLVYPTQPFHVSHFIRGNYGEGKERVLKKNVYFVLKKSK